MGKTNRIGIYAGAFNPVHAGHVGFALQALTAAGLDKVYFLPERQPRHKPGSEHFGHRVAMLTRALQPHRRLKVLEMVDANFSVVRTLPNLQTRFADKELVFLFGSDAIASMPSWPNVAQLLTDTEIIIGLRGGDTAESVERMTRGWLHQPEKVSVLQSFAPDISSSEVREALYQKRVAPGLLQSVRRYSNRNWLYVSLG